MLLALALSGLLFLTLHCQSEHRVCTQMGCSDDMVNVAFPDLKPGTHKILIRADSTIIEKTCEAGEEVTRLDEKTDTVMHSGGPCSLSFHGKFESVQIAVDGKSLGTFYPEYRSVRPNGPDCPPECIQASLIVRTKVQP